MSASADRQLAEGSLAELKARVDLAEIVGRDVDLKRRGRHEVWGCCPLHGERTPSFKVHPERQVFHCFGCGAHGDVLDYLERAENLDKAGAMRCLRGLACSPQAPPAPPRPARRESPEGWDNRELAQETWRDSEAVPGGLPFAYLTERRGINTWDIDRVRWHPACPAKLADDGAVLRRKACIVCPVTDHATGCTRAIWCIRPVLAGKVPRWGLGPSKGNAARLFWAPGPKLIVAEGVEDALAAHVQHDGLPAWAALNAENMKTLMLPPRIREVLIVADHDEPKRDGRRPGLEGAWALAKRLRAESRSAEVRWTTSHKDPNELLLAQRRVAW